VATAPQVHQLRSTDIAALAVRDPGLSCKQGAEPVLTDHVALPPQPNNRLK
jgi:hypothetical protein